MTAARPRAARAWTAAALLALMAAACVPSSRREPQAPPGKPLKVLRGKASWYGRYHHGGATASGERFDMHAFTAAHRTLRFGSIVRVINQKNGRSVVVRINDRGPFGKDRSRIIDLSEAAARKLDMIRAGVVPVVIEVLEEPPRRRKRPPSS